MAKARRKRKAARTGTPPQIKRFFLVTATVVFILLVLMYLFAF
ncbi:hypothetical protein LEM8419_00768 [Neolewinella maritima]|uniref:Uncharacterized protein n=1 Tax=Neolewinella maritima TaxID=1383882 RepID=A0ABM9AZ32_9BACT|nr:hypothetical protein [Neolewinella maritima]CAH0999468.1 hypothetical protein LEM8419_00768 [Neolewinella maritima]